MEAKVLDNTKELAVLHNIFEKLATNGKSETDLKKALASAFYAGKKMGIEEIKEQINRLF